jgi:prepilin-type N-terminal cleavage/methylation domain-containing protein
MQASRQSSSSFWSRGARAAELPIAAQASRGQTAFTLIELILVLALLAICALFVASSLGGFFRGRNLNFEARRMLTLAQYGQSRAVSEGVPVILWIDPRESTYGLTVLATFDPSMDPEGDTKAVTYALDPNITVETPVRDTSSVSERDDERLGVADDLAAIRFNPDGFVDETSVRKITLRLSADLGLELVPKPHGMGYEIRPATSVN